MTTPRKRFGQHFLCDQVVIQRILQALQPRAGEHLLEIGPGQGALTIPLLKQGLSLEAIEIDHDCIAELRARSRDTPALHIHAQDVLKMDFAKLGKAPLRLFGNLPYNISTPLLFHLLKYLPLIKDMVFMLQKEVAERIAAKPDTSDYGRLSVMMQYHCTSELLFNVAPDAFYPPPKVQSSVLRLLPFSECTLRANDYELFAVIVREAFNQRRKTLRNSLKQWLSDSIWEQLTISPKARAEELSVADFVTIANTLKA